jgi:hypothetical protein
VDLLGGWVDEGCDVYAYFNNDWDANAVADGTWLRDRLEAREPLGRPDQRGQRITR